MTPKITLLTPNNALVKKYIDKFNKEDSITDNTIRKLIDRFPTNKDIEDILLKVTVINRLYNTGFYDVYKMARHIRSLNIDARLTSGDLSLVNAIASGHLIIPKKAHTEIYCYSFATKYCNWHNHSAFPIFDSHVGKILFEYQRRDGFAKFKKKDLWDYTRFKDIIGDFLRYYSLSGYDLKQLDKFLWKYAQEVYS